MIKIIEYWLPIVVCAESILACIPLFVVGKYGSGIYWLLAGLISATATFLIPKLGRVIK